MEKRKPNRKSIPITVTIERELLAQIDGLASAQNLTRSQFIVRQVRNGIDQERAMVALIASPHLAKNLATMFSTPETMKAVGLALKDEVTQEQLETFNRGFHGLSNQASAALKKGKKS